ncbi:MAG: flagellar hook protein FlgE [Methylophilaceae bacterium]|nr:flagellar hook protein FlgE [Methylophilaceae bacterium]
MGFQQGLSGLNVAAKNLDVIGNNVANAGTVGFKSGQAQFADVFAASLQGAGSLPVGLGAKIATIVQQFTQGNITSTNNPLDLAINGGGFFRMSDAAGTVSYTRNGQFQFDKNDYIVNADGLRLMGYSAINGVIQTGNPVALQLDRSDLTPQATGTSTTGVPGVQAMLNLDSGANVITVPFVYTDPTTFNHSTSISVYDSLGNAHTYTLYFIKTAPNTWDVQATLTNPLGTTTPQGLVGTLNFNTSGILTTAMPLTESIPAASLGTGAAALTFDVDFTSTTQFGGAFSVNTLRQDGYPLGKLSGFTVGADGILVGRYTNGQSRNLGQVILASFANPQGLQAVGNNQWIQTSASGPELIGTPGSDGQHGVIQSSAVEDSNVDLTAELVNMITAQRYYQANAQTIKTQDTIMQTLVNLR